MRKILFIVLVLIACSTVLLQTQADRGKERLKREEGGVFIPPRPDYIKHLSLGYHTLLADVYWLRSVQYLAEATRENEVPQGLYPMARFITELDPRFAMAYYFTGLNLMIYGGDSEQTIDILERGARNTPQYWKTSFALGFYYFFVLQEPGKAATHMERACRYRKDYTCMLAARMKSQAGDPDTAIGLLMGMRDQIKEKRFKRSLEQRTKELLAIKREGELTQQVGLYHEKTGKWPDSIQDLIVAGIINKTPGHPLPEHRFVYDPEHRRIVSDPPVVKGVFDPWARKRKSRTRAEGSP